MIQRRRCSQRSAGEGGAVVPIIGKPAASPGCNEKVFITVTVDVVPRDARAERAESVWDECLTAKIVERCLDMCVVEEIRDVREQSGDSGAAKVYGTKA